MGIQNNAAAGRDFRDDILREQVRLVFQHLPTMQAASLAVALVLCHVVRDMAPLRNILTWILMVLAVVLARIILYHRFGKVGAGRFSGERWRNAYIALAFASGIIWGLAAFIVFPGGRLELMALFVLVITSLAAATTVTNTGCGLDTTATEKIFDPFFSTKFTGRGLGLPVVLGIARAHDGGIGVENNPGGGTKFHVYLPVEGNVPYLGNNRYSCSRGASRVMKKSKGLYPSWVHSSQMPPLRAAGAAPDRASSRIASDGTPRFCTKAWMITFPTSAGAYLNHREEGCRHEKLPMRTLVE